MKDYTQFTKEEKISFWQKHLDDWKESGFSQKKYCENSKISYWNFRTWYDKTKIESGVKQSRFIRIKTGEIHIEYPGKIEIIFPNNIKIIAEESIPESSLKKIFSAIGYSND